MVTSGLTALADADLLDHVRRGDETAFTELYVRHREVACRMASVFCRSSEVDDLVDVAFEKVLGALRRGRGPTGAFRAYLFVTLRRLAAEQANRLSEQPLDEVPESVVAAASAERLDPAERDMITLAFDALPDRWQAVLWHTAVEGRHPRELASTLGLTANAVSALAYRAREKLRQAYLQAHLRAAPRPQCEPHRSLLGAYVRDGQSRRDRRATHDHVDGCHACQALVAELTDVNRLLARAIVPFFGIGSVGALSKVVAVGGGGAPAAAGAAQVAHMGARSLRRVLWGVDRVPRVGALVGGVAATAALLVGVMELKPHLTDQRPVGTEVSGTTTDAAAGPAAEDPPAVVGEAVRMVARCPGAAPTTATPSAANSSSATTTNAGPSGSGGGLLSSVLNPVLAIVEGLTDAPSAAGTPLALNEIVCTSNGEGPGDLTLSLGTTETTDGVVGEQQTLLSELPVDAKVTIELSDGLRLALEAGLPEGCELSQDGRALTCTLQQLLPGLPAAMVGLDVVAQGANTGATITVRDGDQTILSQSVDLGPVLGVLLPGATTTTRN